MLRKTYSNDEIFSLNILIFSYFFYPKNVSELFKRLLLFDH